MKIAFFLTGHGFGHGVRSAALMEKISSEIQIDIYTSLPENFFAEELHRPYEVIACEIDCGCLQTDTITVDVEATLKRYSELNSNRTTFIGHYAKILKERGTDLIIGDIPPLAFPIAKAAGIPAWSFCNFDWVDIYRPYLAEFPEYQNLVRQMEADYSLADHRIRFFPEMTRSELPPYQKVGMVCRPGQSRREEFAEQFGLNPQKKWGLIYVGSFGLEGVAWNRLSEFSEWEFLGLYQLDHAPENYHQIKKNPHFRYADLTASSDLVIGKLGYGLVTECLSLGKPVLFLGRKDFAEFDLLKNLLLARNMGLEINLQAFLRLDIADALKALTARNFEALQATGVGNILKILNLNGLILN